ncbi:Rab-GTPase-TBC domain-containing protein [Helicosporidium sp. ATCC 50920]|nr:Rab-GTPase-TBC domain-containing protein [Helicosporidium sp. ATCC 50920]|eukprot:KDD75243.1 Rab-GTPase-TBC domain-containing protein [Helicosporidium sp. ATCC 50920]
MRVKLQNQTTPVPLSGREMFQRALAAPVVDLDELRDLVRAYGLPDETKLRPVVWQLLLNYLPESQKDRASFVAAKRAEYAQFCQELVRDASSLTASPAATPCSSSSDLPRRVQQDHPLSSHQDSSWNAFFADAATQEQIARDVDRTHPDLHFFCGTGPRPSRHRAAMRRALFVYAKLNPGLSYVQGMNEVFAPLYYVLCCQDEARSSEDEAEDGDENQADPATDSSASPAPGPAAAPLKHSLPAHHATADPLLAPSPSQDPRAAEADAFFCFVALMSEFRDNFCHALDESSEGIRAALARLSASLRGLDPELSSHLEQRNGVAPHYYAFRWLTLLLTQEFAFPDVLRLWDTLLASPPGQKPPCLARLALAMLLLARDQILEGDFGANVRLLQHYPAADVGVIVQRASLLQSYGRC